MKRHYFLSDDLDALDRLEAELLAAGFGTPQMHVLSRDDAGVANRKHLTPLEAVLKKDVVRGTELGSVIGVAGAALVLGVAYLTGVTVTVGWVPFLFLAIVVLGFCTWEGGLFGIQEPNREFVRFEADIKAGRHLFMADVTAAEEATLKQVVEAHPGISAAGEGQATPEFVVRAHKRFNSAMETLP
jgi:hypothetical protein